MPEQKAPHESATEQAGEHGMTRPQNEGSLATQLPQATRGAILAGWQPQLIQTRVNV